MRKIIYIFLCIIFTSIAHASSVTLLSGEYAPYTGENIPGHGISTLIVKAAFKESGRTVIVDFMPWNRIMNNMLNGSASGSFPWTLTAERQKYMLYSDPIHNYRLLLFKKKNDMLKNVEVTGKTFCLPSGWDNSPYLEIENKYKTKIVRPISIDSCIQMLALGRVDLIFMNEYVGRNMLKKLYGRKSPIEGFSSPLFDVVKSLYLVVPKNSLNGINLINEFNVGLQKIKRNGVYADIISGYFNKESSISTCEACNQLGSL